MDLTKRRYFELAEAHRQSEEYYKKQALKHHHAVMRYTRLAKGAKDAEQ